MYTSSHTAHRQNSQPSHRVYKPLSAFFMIIMTLIIMCVMIVYIIMFMWTREGTPV